MWRRRCAKPTSSATTTRIPAPPVCSNCLSTRPSAAPGSCSKPAVRKALTRREAAQGSRNGLRRTEAVVDAEHGGVDPVLDLDRRCGAGGVAVTLQRERLRSEVHVVIFGEHRPIRRNQKFDTAACGPSGARIRSGEGEGEGAHAADRV